MEIHGHDISIKSSIPIADNLIRFLVQDHWPKLVYEINKQSDAIDMFIYKDEYAKHRWDTEGWSENNDTTMIYVVFSNDFKEIRFTIDDFGINMPIVEDLIQFIRRCDD